MNPPETGTGTAPEVMVLASDLRFRTCEEARLEVRLVLRARGDGTRTFTVPLGGPCRSETEGGGCAARVTREVVLGARLGDPPGGPEGGAAAGDAVDPGAVELHLDRDLRAGETVIVDVRRELAGLRAAHGRLVVPAPLAAGLVAAHVLLPGPERVVTLRRTWVPREGEAEVEEAPPAVRRSMDLIRMDTAPGRAELSWWVPR